MSDPRGKIFYVSNETQGPQDDDQEPNADAPTGDSEAGADASELEPDIAIGADATGPMGWEAIVKRSADLSKAVSALSPRFKMPTVPMPKFDWGLDLDILGDHGLSQLTNAAKAIEAVEASSAPQFPDLGTLQAFSPDALKISRPDLKYMRATNELLGEMAKQGRDDSQRNRWVLRWTAVAAAGGLIAAVAGVLLLFRP